ncbi:MAG TPA: type I phosphomannose isomerase catalytic subunit [Verrucomicrobiae bacterium]|nr:type I phosphomannose isomerase catalytic subunit [Verrucomicrobiae bacterium]
MLYPLTFKPIFKERVWGGRRLEDLFHKPLPPGKVIGESWEVSDRPGDVSVIANGSLAGIDLQWLITNHGKELFGAAKPPARFPLLIKLLDAQDKLSLQVHPPRAHAAALGGEPKTEMWYIAEARPGAELYVGLKRGVTRKEFETKLQEGTVAECFHRVQVRAGDAMFLPSGRVHAIGAGLVIFEIQQNSDTTYRVFDWNRFGLDGQPRALHVEESLRSIDFEDIEPPLVRAEARSDSAGAVRQLVRDPLFDIDALGLLAGAVWRLESAKLHILGVVSGKVEASSAAGSVVLDAGQFCLIPASLTDVVLRAGTEATVLRSSLGGETRV